MNRTHLPPTSPKQIYLACEGVGGYTRGSYKQKSELDAISTQGKPGHPLPKTVGCLSTIGKSEAPNIYLITRLM